MTTRHELTSHLAPNNPIAVSPNEAARLVGLGRTTIYAALSSGELRSAKVGKRRLITIVAINEWLGACEVPSAALDGGDAK